MYLDAVVCVAVGELAAQAFGKGCEGIGQLGVVLHLGALFLGQAALLGDVLVHLIHIHEAGALVQQGAGGIQLTLHQRYDFVHRRELDDGFAELLAVLGVCESLAVSLLADADALCGYAEAGAVHQGHDILDKAELAGAYQFCGSVFIDQFASGASLDTHLVLYAAHIHATVTLVVNEHRKSAAIMRPLL